MNRYLEDLAETLGNHYGGILLGLSIGSVIMILAFLTIGARVLARITPDYFINDKARAERRYLRRFPVVLRPLIQGLKNLIGAVLVAVGIILLVLPGQGLLTMLAGLLLMEFPGKYACERWIVRRPQVHNSINWIRKRAGQPPLLMHRDERD